MNTYISLFTLAWILSLVGYLWLVVVAFKRSVLWGVLVLFFSPITAIIFSLMNWFDARKAFIVYISSFVLSIGVVIYIYGQVGVGNMQQIATRMQSGKLPPARAYQLIVKAMGSSGNGDLFAEATPSLPASPELARVSDEQSDAAPMPVTDAPLAAQTQPQPAAQSKPAPAKTSDKPADDQAVENNTDTKAAKPAAKDTQNDNKETKAEKPVESVPDFKKVQPDPLAQKRKEPEPNTVRVRLDKMHNYIGRYFIVTLKKGNERRGLLRKVDSNTLILDRKLYGGNFQYKIAKSQIKSIQMLTRMPDER